MQNAPLNGDSQFDYHGNTSPSFYSYTIAQIRQDNEKAGEASLNTQIETWARNTARISRSGAEEETPATTQLAKFLNYIGWTVRA